MSFAQCACANLFAIVAIVGPVIAEEQQTLCLPAAGGIEFVGEINTVFDPDFAKTHPEITNDLLRLRRKIEYNSSGQSLMIDLDCNSESGKTHVGSYRGATNGQGMQTLDRRTQILILTKANDFLPLFMGMDPISRSYGFLQDLSPTQSLPLSPGEIAQRWSAISQKLVASTVKAPSESPSKMSDFEFESEKGFKFVVHLDSEKMFFPVAHECYASNGTLLAKYRVVELGQIKEDSGTSLYPKSATIELFDLDGKPIRTDTFLIKDIKFAPKEADSEKFSINPTFAKKIWDKDNNIWVDTGSEASQ